MNLRVSIVTPTLNQAANLEATMRSVLDQGRDAVEYVVVDGGSTDGSAAVAECCRTATTDWISEPDAGPYDAVNKGFARSSGEIMAWLNAGDSHLPWTLSVVAEIFGQFPDVEWITTLYPIQADADGRPVNCCYRPVPTQAGIRRGQALPAPPWHGADWIQQESTFWRRSLWERAGGCLDLSYPLAADFDLWLRFAELTDLVGVGVPLAAFRVQAGQRSERHYADYVREADAAIRKRGTRPRGPVRRWTDRHVLSRTPPALQGLMRDHGWLSPSRICVNPDRAAGWQLVSRLRP